MPTFKAGDTVFNLEGRKGRYVIQVAGGHIVEPEFYDEDNQETFFDKAVTWPKVFTKAPIEVYDAEVEKKSKLLSEICSEYADKRVKLCLITEEIQQSESNRKRLLAQFKQTEELQRIEDFLTGKFSHFLICSSFGAPVVTDKDSALKESPERRYDYAVKLLCLFGKVDGKLEWRLNRWENGSGEWTEVYPCFSKEEAIEKLRNLYADAVESWRTTKVLDGRAVTWAKSPYVTVPDDLKEWFRARALEVKRKLVEDRRRYLATAEAELAELMSAEPATQPVSEAELAAS